MLCFVSYVGEMFDLIDITFDPHTLYHVSPKQYDFPCRQKINEAREWSRWHANGVMGLWCSTLPNMCMGFGKHIYQVDIKEDAIIKGVSLQQLFDVTSEMEDFSELIAGLENKVDVIYVVDSNPYVGEVIVINFSSIKNFTEVNEADDTRAYMGHDTY